MYLGAHIGISGGLAGVPALGRGIGCEAIQIFSKSPQMWAGPPVAPESSAAFQEAVRTEGLKGTAVHHGYLTNLASPKPAGWKRSRRAFLDELRRAEQLGVDALIVHPGAHLGSGTEAGARRVAESLNEAFGLTEGFRVLTLLENMAGQGSTLGADFHELAIIRDQVKERRRLGVALDTCHTFAAGHDFRTDETYGGLIDRIGAELGVETVRAFHFNDAKAPLGSHLDRHENIGKGEIGLEGFRRFVNDPRWRDRPAYLETPLGEDDYGAYRTDLATLRGLIEPMTDAASPPTVPDMRGARRVGRGPR
ncbi:MAG TPA: deoxyribonuclease IV [Thermoplasmata archaeon]|nr:deoxyribonuclease IV [Thermoplasmata archaeon]